MAPLPPPVPEPSTSTPAPAEPGATGGAAAPTKTPAAEKAPAKKAPVKKAPAKKTVKKIVKKVPVARAPGAGTPSPSPSLAPSRSPVETRPPPPAATAPRAEPAVFNRPPPPEVTEVEPVTRVGPLQRRRLGRLRARRVRRILRHVEVWSVLKVSLVFYFCVWLVLLVSGAVLWKVATQAGLIDNVENFLQESGFDEVELDGETMFRAWATGGFIMVFATTGFTVLLAVLFNLISDLMGGIRFSVIELETIRRRPRRPRGGGGDG